MRLSVIMPSYNEAEAIRDAVREVQEHVFSVVAESELIVVDSSDDQTGAILEELAAAEPRLRVIHQGKLGHGRALRTGMDAAQGEFLFLIDSDRQIPLSAFPALWELAQSRDAAFGIRRQRHDPWLRLRLTALVRRTINLLFGVRIYDANVPFKIVRRSAWEAARAVIPENVLAPSLFLAIFLHRACYQVAAMDVPHVERQTGVVSIRRWKLFKVCLRGLRELLAFRVRLKELRITSGDRQGAVFPAP